MKILKWLWLAVPVLGALIAYVLTPPFYRPVQEIDFPVYSRNSAREISARLKEKGAILHALPFRVLTKATRKDRKLKAGLYRLNTRMSLWQVLSTLSEGKSELLTLKMPEGFTMRQVAQELERMKVVTAADFLRTAQEGAFLKELGVPGPHAEGYLFPETYRIPLGAGPPALLELMVRQFFNSVGQGFSERCKERGLTPYQAVILASIVEKEAQKAEERPIIAGVIYNRLEKKMRLEVNATLEYVLNTKNAWLTNKQLDTQSPYNTYRRRGLPPTPICNPGTASLEAVLSPAVVDYLYYVAQGDGSHLFAADFKQHQKNVFLAKKERRRKRLEDAARRSQ